MADRDGKDFTFMSEQLKKRPFYRKKWFQKSVSAAALAILFGTAAGVAFSVVQPWAKKQFGEPQDPAQIYVVQEDTETEAQTETEETEAPPKTVIEEKELEIYDYKMLYSKMSQVAEGLSDSVVTVTCERSGVDWFNEVIENQTQTAGLVIAQSDTEYFILNGSQASAEAERIIVTFSDGSVADASLRKKDNVTGLSVVCVPKSALEGMEQQPVPVELSGKRIISQGAPVIALGTPVGNNPSVSFGMVTSVVDTPVMDSQYRVLSTDILGSEQGSGILIDLDGKVVGIIAQNFSVNGGQITLSALAAADLRDLTEDMVYGRVRASVGITGKEIDEKLSEEFEMPRGIYVRDIAADSPAMYAGIYEADIIVSIDDEPVETAKDYEEKLKEHEPEEQVKIGIRRAAMDGYVDLEIPVQLGSR